ncbi:hypothetical protein OSTOST_01641 [Ostertagia ostertagi]
MDDSEVAPHLAKISSTPRTTAQSDVICWYRTDAAVVAGYRVELSVDSMVCWYRTDAAVVAGYRVELSVDSMG